MTDLVELLERLGSEACFHGENSGDLASAVAASDLEAPIKGALLAGDSLRVLDLAGHRPLVAMIMPAEEEEEGEEEKEDSPDPGTPSSEFALFTVMSD